MSESFTPPMATPRVAAGALIHDGGSRVLLIKPVYKPGWDLPGGYVEPGESPTRACERLLLDEIGLARPIRRLLVVDWAPHPAEGDKILFIFDGGTLTADETAGLTLDRHEIGEARFHDASVIAGLMPARLSKRVLIALESVYYKTTAYAEHGLTRSP